VGKRTRDRDNPNPEVQRWGRTYPRFPGVAECARLIKAREARGVWADIIAYELANNAHACLPELIEAFRKDRGGDVGLYVMMALDIARLPETVPFLAEVLTEGNPAFVPYALRALEGINTPESRSALWHMKDRYPNDADGDALRRIAAGPNDMSQPMEIDFFVVAPDHAAGKKIAKAASNVGYRTKLERDEHGLTCNCSKRMLATYTGVIEAQRELNELSRCFGGHIDGWGTFGNAGPRPKNRAK
jgi:hypothetical protein